MWRMKTSIENQSVKWIRSKYYYLPYYEEVSPVEIKSDDPKDVLTF